MEIAVYRHSDEPEVLENPPKVSGEEMLPEFGLDLTEIW